MEISWFCGHVTSSVVEFILYYVALCFSFACHTLLFGFSFTFFISYYYDLHSF